MMRGHQPLIDMRLRRRKPVGYVCITVGQQDRSWIAEHWHESDVSGPVIAIGANEAINRLDLRFVLGLEIVVDGDEAHSAAVWRVFDACQRQGAARVIGGVHRTRGEELVAIENRDSKGILTWHE